MAVLTSKTDLNASLGDTFVNANGFTEVIARVDDAAAGQYLWQPQTSDFVATIIDSSGGAVTETLSAANGSGVVRFFANEDVLTNPATLAVQPGESLNGVVDGTFSFDSYDDGTQFRATDTGVGQWYVEIDGAATKDELISFYANMLVTTDLPAAFDTGGIMDFSDASIIKNDPEGFWSAAAPTRFTFPKAGNFLVKFTANYNDSGNDLDTLILRLNGATTLQAYPLFEDTGGNRANVHLEYVGDFAAGDYVEILDPDLANIAVLMTGITVRIDQRPSESVVLAGSLPLEDTRDLLGSGAAVVNGGTVTISSLWGSLFPTYETVEIQVVGVAGTDTYRQSLVLETQNWADNTAGVFISDAVNLITVFDMDATAATLTLNLGGPSITAADVYVYGNKAQKTVIRANEAPVQNVSANKDDVLYWSDANGQYEPRSPWLEQTIASAPGLMTVDADLGRIVNVTMDTTNVTIDPVLNLTAGTMVMRLVASGAARSVDLSAAIKRPAALTLPLSVPDGQAAIVSITTIGGVQSANVTLEAL